MHLPNSLNFFKMRDAVNKFLIGAFSEAVSSVQPKNLINRNIIYNKTEEHLKVFIDVYDLKNRSVYLVGAGKAVLQMATEIEQVIDGKLQTGIISIPAGITQRYPLNPKTVIEYYEGAENNLPDDKSVYAAKQIINLVNKMDDKCLLLVLMSGGGSALLPSPIPPVSLKEKSQLIKDLSRAGADIIEMNTVRKKLSNIKGGKLLELAHPAEVVTLLMSDIVGNLADSIASGPTFVNNDKPLDALKIVEKYSLLSSLTDSVKKVLNSTIPAVKIEAKNLKVSNYVLANNTGAIDVSNTKIKSEGYDTYILTDQVQGDIEDVSSEYCQLISTIINVHSETLSKHAAMDIIKNFKNIPLNDDFIERFAYINLNNNKGVCLIAGGEPTVIVKGSGKGGRNQHIALSFSHKFHLESLKNSALNNFEVFLLSAGTDGMDGPTDAAGAIGYGDLVSDANVQNLSVESFLSNNDSYKFFSKFSDGRNHIKIGHTNTNVMDIHIVLIRLRK